MTRIVLCKSKAQQLARVLLVLLLTFTSTAAVSTSLRFFGNGVSDIDRVKIRIDDPADNNPGPPADIGASDFTIEFWLKATSDNTAGAIVCGENYDWIVGNIVFDRDRFDQGRAFGISLGAGRLVFGVVNASYQPRTICGSTDLRDGTWHHVALQRRRSDGFLWLYVDGTLESSVNGPDGDLSYPDDGVPGNFCNGPCTGSDPFIVIGAEKHDAGSAFPAYFGWVDEVRLSDVLRYSANFVPPQQAFVADPDTAALYHFDEGSGDFIGDSSFNSLSPGERRFGGNPAGPLWVADTPFSGGGGNPGTLQFSTSNYTAGEGAGSQMITVTRTGGSTGTVTVDYATADGTATSGSDYQATSGSLNWADGDAAWKSFSIPIVDDGEVESDETVNVTLSNANGGATLGNPSTASVTITDNDVTVPGQLQLSAPSYTVAEGAGSLTISVTRTIGSDGAVSVSYGVGGGTATSGTDYQATSGILNWADGDAASKSFSIPIVDDGEVESDETVNVTLSNANGGATLGNPSTASVTITDNDVAVPGQIRLSSSAYSVSEASGSVAVSVRRTGGVDGVASVDYSVSDGTAVSGLDYQSVSGTLNWADGDSSSKTFDISLIDNASVDGDKTLNISLGNASGATLGSPASAVLTIVDDDVAVPGSIKLSAAAYSITEGSGDAIITVIRTGGSSGPVSVDYSVSDGSATSGSDYQIAMGTLSWPDGDVSAMTFVIPIMDDLTVENDETVNISLTNITGGATFGTPVSAMLTITDNDVPNPGSIQLSSAAYSVGENAGTATMTVIRSGGSDGSVTVDYSITDGTAISGADYQTTVGTLSWADGDLSEKSFSISINDDGETEGDETINISLENVTGATLGNPQTAVLTIVDDEVATPGTVQFSAPEYSVGEGGGSILITVNRSGGAKGAVSVDYSLDDGTATAGSDYQPASGTLSWSDGDVSEKTIVVSVLDDDVDESNETVTISLNNPTAGLVIGNPSSATLTIFDDDTTLQNSVGGGGSSGAFFLVGVFLLMTSRLKMHSQSTLRRPWSRASLLRFPDR